MNAINNAFDPSDNSVRVKWDIQITAWDVEKVKNATDLDEVISFLDIWTADERVDNIIYSSISEWLSYTDTYWYVGVSWNYTNISITRS